MSVLGRIFSLLPSRRRNAIRALPPPGFAAPQLDLWANQASAPAVIIAGPPPREEHSGATRSVPPAEVAPPEPAASVETPPPPQRQRRPPRDPKERARYFGTIGAPARATHSAAIPAMSPSVRQSGAVPPQRVLATGSKSSTSAAFDQVDPIAFAAFLIWPEGARETPEEATALWRAEMKLRDAARALRDRALAQSASGGLPLRPASLFDLAMQIVGNAGAALLTCHVVTRLFARGGEIVEWRVMDRAEGIFSDGMRSIRPAPLASPDGSLSTVAQAFYALFAASAFGVADTGDWYRFFALATMSYLVASERSAAPRASGAGAAKELARDLDRVIAGLRDGAAEDTTAYRGWLWANALLFVEYGRWAHADARALEASRIGVAATLFGLRLAGAHPEPSWHWAVPQAGGLRDRNAGALPTRAVLTPADALVA